MKIMTPNWDVINASKNTLIVIMFNYFFQLDLIIISVTFHEAAFITHDSNFSFAILLKMSKP